MKTKQAPQPNAHSVARRLDAIKALRHEHSRKFLAGDFASMQRVTEKIKTAWRDYDFACECAHQKQVCFNCTGKPKAEFSVESPGRQPMLFCCAECRLEFGVSLGLT